MQKKFKKRKNLNPKTALDFFTSFDHLKVMLFLYMNDKTIEETKV